MAGYADDWSMSNNAIDAYDRACAPAPSGTRLTSWTRSPPTLERTYSSTNTRSSSCESTSSRSKSGTTPRSTTTARTSAAPASPTGPPARQRMCKTSTAYGRNANRKHRQRKPPPHARFALPTRTGSTSAPTEPSPSTRSFVDPGYTRRAAYVNAPTAPTFASMRPTSAPPEGQPRSSRRSNAA